MTGASNYVACVGRPWKAVIHVDDKGGDVYGLLRSVGLGLE